MTELRLYSRDDYDIEDLLLPHEEDQPLPQEELRQRIMNRVRKQTHAHAHTLVKMASSFIRFWHV